ncbi:epoxide hydrolase N-terminal domain-containing protein [Streptomyces sp. MCAF7]
MTTYDTPTNDTPTPYTIDVPDTELTDLRERLARTRWADSVADDWQRGTSPSALRALVQYWRDGPAVLAHFRRPLRPRPRRAGLPRPGPGLGAA